MVELVGVAVAVLLLLALVVGVLARSRPAGPPPIPRPLPPELQSRVRQLVGQNQKIHAVKEVREATGFSLLDAKNAVDAIADGRSVPVPGREWPEPRRPDLADRARSLAAAGRHDEAVRVVAAETGMSAPEADAFVRALLP